jgi:hypothetical protein
MSRHTKRERRPLFGAGPTQHGVIGYVNFYGACGLLFCTHSSDCVNVQQKSVSKESSTKSSGRIRSGWSQHQANTLVHKARRTEEVQHSGTHDENVFIVNSANAHVKQQSLYATRFKFCCRALTLCIHAYVHVINQRNATTSSGWQVWLRLAMRNFRAPALMLSQSD